MYCIRYKKKTETFNIIHIQTKKFQRCHVEVKRIDDIWGADLVEMQEWEKEKEGFRSILNIIDAFFKFA